MWFKTYARKVDNLRYLLDEFSSGYTPWQWKHKKDIDMARFQRAKELFNQVIEEASEVKMSKKDIENDSWWEIDYMINECLRKLKNMANNLNINMEDE